MRILEISEFDFSPREKLYSEGHESKRFIRDGKVFKFIYPSFRKNRDKIIEGIYRDKLVNTVKPAELLTTNGEFVGYSMESLDEFYNIENYLLCCPYVYKHRLGICLELATALEDIIKKGYEHYDLHNGNIMVADSKGRIIDIDSMCNPSLGVSINNSSYNTLVDSAEENDINKDMKKNLAMIISALITNGEGIKDLHTIKMVLNEFQDDEIMALSIRRRAQLLIDRGYSLSDIICGFTEEKIEKCMSLQRKYSNE